MLTIRPATLADAPSIVEGNLQMAWETEHLRLDPATLTPGVQTVLLDSTKGLYFIADLDGKYAGQLMITWEWSDWRNGNIWWIQSVYVLPDARRRGIFRALYTHARTAAQKQNAVGLRLYVEETNTTGQATYTALGMTLTHYKIMEDMFHGSGD